MTPTGRVVVMSGVLVVKAVGALVTLLLGWVVALFTCADAPKSSTMTQNAKNMAKPINFASIIPLSEKCIANKFQKKTCLYHRFSATSI